MADWQAVIDGLEALALASGREGDTALAAHLLSATSYWRKQLGLPMPPVERPALEALREAVLGGEGHVAGHAPPSLERLVSEAIAGAAIPAHPD
jgi:hypothetical protein